MSATTDFDRLILGAGQQGAEYLLKSETLSQRLAVVDQKADFPLACLQASQQLASEGQTCQLLAATQITDLRRDPQGYFYLTTFEGKQLKAQQLVVTAGAKSLELAQKMGYAEEYFLLPVRKDHLLVEEQQVSIHCLQINRTFWMTRHPVKALASLIKNKELRHLSLFSLGYHLPLIRQQLLKRQLKKAGITSTSTELQVIKGKTAFWVINLTSSVQEPAGLEVTPCPGLTFVLP